MGKTFRLLFNLYPGEGRRAVFFIFLALLWGIGSYGTLTLSEGMFLEHVGSQALPYAYFIIALCMCVLSAVLIYSLNHVSIRTLLFSLISCWIVSNLIFYFLLPIYGSSIHFWYVFKVIGWMTPLSTYIVYWAFVDQYYDLQDGKRFFCLFNGIVFLSDAIGGGIVAFLLGSFAIGGLLVIFIATMALALPVILLISKKLDPVLEEHTESVVSTSSMKFTSIVKTVLSSKFTLYLLVFYFTMQLLAIVTEFNFMESFEKVFTGREENVLTEFLGSCSMWISLGNMILALFLYSRLIKKIGINNIILVAPFFFLAIFSVWCFKDVLIVAIFGMIAREGMVYTFDDNNLNLLLSGVPTKVKNQVRISVESFIEPTGMLCCGFLLLILQNKGHLLGLCLSLLALVAVVLLRAHYRGALFRNLSINAIRFEKKSIDWIASFSRSEKKQVEFLLLTNLRGSDEKNQLLAFEYLLKIGNTKLIPRLLNYFTRLTLVGKLRVIELLSESHWATNPIILEKLERWLQILPHPSIRSAIHFYFARHNLLRPERILQDLHNEHLGLRVAAILTMKTTDRSFQFPSFCLIASQKLQLLLESNKEEEICAGLKILEFEQPSDAIEQIFAHIKHSSITVNRAAAKTLSVIAHPDKKHHAPRLIHDLHSIRDGVVRMCCLEALVNFSDTDSLRDLILGSVHFHPSERKQVERVAASMGSQVVPLLLQITQETTVPDRCRFLAGKILGRLDLKVLQKNLFHIVNKEIERAYFYYYHALEIPRQIPEQDLSILEDALLTSYQSIIDFIIHLLGTAGSIEDSDILVATLRSKNRKIRGTALESLEKACEGRIFTTLERLIDERNPKEKLDNYLKGGRLPLNLTQLLDMMVNSPSTADQIVALVLKARLETPDWRQAVKKKLDSNNKIFHEFGQELLKGEL